MPNKSSRGKKEHQKFKSYLVLQYLLKYSDEDHLVNALDICAYLQENGIEAERRSIYRDVDEINVISLMLQEDCSLGEAEEMLDDDPDDETLRLIRVKKAGRNSGFYAQRNYELDDIRLLAESVYSAKFISEAESKRLVNVITDLVSDYQAKKITHDAFLTDRAKTANKSVYGNIMTINTAMSRSLEGFKKEPEKITFKYTKYSISDMSGKAERRQGSLYTVSPYKLLINDGNYYLLAFDDRAQDMRTYRVDRMKDVKRLIGTPRDGEEVFKSIDLKTYTQRVFGMFGGKDKLVTLRFINPLLDTVVDRFGVNGCSYSKVDASHFQIITHVEISDQFFSWLTGFGKKVKITNPPEVAEQFKNYLDKIRGMYED